MPSQNGSQSSCANPLYLGWIREWWDAANANNAKDRLTYKRAWESMKANPIEFTHPSEAVQLTGIGPKLVERLTEKFETYCRDEGLPMPTKPRKRKRGQAASSIEEQDEIGSGSLRKARKQQLKGYVPKQRSGAYALLLTLAELPEGETIGLTKAELQDQAQPLADASFTVPPDPSKFHTAWNGMATLESKHLVYTFGRPTKRYALTDEGWATAKSMKAILNDAAPAQIPAPAPVLNSIGNQSSRHPAQNVVAIAIDDTDTQALEMTDTRPTFESRIQQKFGSQDNFMKVMRDRLFGNGDSEFGLDAESLALIEESMQRSTSGNKSIPQSKSGTAATNPSKRNQSITASSSKSLSFASPVGNAAPLAVDSLQRSDSSTSVPLNADTIPAYEPIVAPPGSFSVELVLDSREVRSKTDRNYIQEQFKQFGLRCEQRSLAVGDMIWTARIHDPTIVSQLPIDDRKVPEIVLDYVVERKRLDDLDSSIKDKRFLEQKFRLKRSGIRNGIYIVEDYGSIQAMEDQQHTRLMTAMASTQIIDGLFVKRTRKLDDTIAYLAGITRLLREQYESKPLYIIPSSVLTPQNHWILRAPKDESGAHHYISYLAQDGLASKSSLLTTRDIFLKMLMCTRGITGDKAIEIQKRWKTPRSFINAYRSLLTSTEKNDMVFKVAGHLQGKRKIGKAVSQTLAEIWGTV